MSASATRRVRITWIERGTRNAAMLGLEETMDTDWSLEECLEAAQYRANVIGVDLHRFEPVVEEID